MKMPKSRKAQLVGEVIKYALVGLFSVVIIVIGYNAINSVKNASCKTELSKFQIDLGNLGSGLRSGEKEEQSFSVPCDVDRIYMFGLGKNINYELINESPLVLDAVKSSSKNIFLLRNGELSSSFNAGDINIDFPYNICFVPKFGKIYFSVEGGKHTLVESAIDQPECTVYPLVASHDDGVSIISDAAAANDEPGNLCSKCPSGATDTESEKGKIEVTKRNVDISQKFSVEGNKTRIEVTLKPKKGKSLKEFKLYESIPGQCISDLSDYIEGTIKEGEYVKIRSGDLLIVWKLDDTLKEQKTLSYKIKKLFNPQCRGLIKAVAVANRID